MIVRANLSVINRLPATDLVWTLSTELRVLGSNPSLSSKDRPRVWVIEFTTNQ